MHFDPAKMPPRDFEGYAWHPDLWDHHWYNGDPADEGQLDPYAFTAAGLECRWVKRDDDDHGDRCDQETGCGAWVPSLPSWEGWRLVRVSRTAEHGDVALFVRDIEDAGEQALAA